MSGAGDGPSDGAGVGEGLFAAVVPNTIRRRFALKFALVLLVMAVSVGGIGLTATMEVQQYTERQVTDEYRGIAATDSESIAEWLDRKRVSARFVASSRSWSGENTDGLLATLQNQKGELSGDAANLHLVSRGATGTEVVASTSLSSGTPLSDGARSWVGAEEFTHVSEVATSSVYRTGSGPVVGFLIKAEGSLNRYLLIEYNVSDVADSLQGRDRAAGGFTQVVNSSNVVVLDEPSEDGGPVGEETLALYSQSEGATTPIDRANGLRNTSTAAGVLTKMPGTGDVIDGEYTVGYAPVAGSDWVVLVHAPHDSVFGTIQQVRMLGLIGTAVMVLFIGGAGAALGYNTASSIDRLTDKTAEMEKGNLDVTVETPRVDSIGRLYDGFAAMRDALQEQIDEAERARKEAEVSRAEAIEMNNYLQEKAEEFSDVMEATAAGDLTDRMETDGENESMDRIATEFNEMIAELEKTVGQLDSFADEVAESGTVVLTSAESVGEASEQVAESIQRISDDAYEQKEQLRTISQDLDVLVEQLEGLVASTDDSELADALTEFRSVATALQTAADTSEEMMAEAETVAGAAEEQAAELSEVTTRAQKLKRYARPLGDILDRFDTEAEHEFVFSGGPSQETPDDD